MTLEQRIEAIYKLDAIRTQGWWDYNAHPMNKELPRVQAPYQGGHVGVAYLGKDLYSDRDGAFIAAAPEMVDIIRSLEAKVEELEKLLRYGTLDELAKESERLGFYNEEQNENN